MWSNDKKKLVLGAAALVVALIVAIILIQKREAEKEDLHAGWAAVPPAAGGCGRSVQAASCGDGFGEYGHGRVTCGGVMPRYAGPRWEGLSTYEPHTYGRMGHTDMADRYAEASLQAQANRVAGVHALSYTPLNRYTTGDNRADVHEYGVWATAPAKWQEGMPSALEIDVPANISSATGLRQAALLQRGWTGGDYHLPGDGDGLHVGAPGADSLTSAPLPMYSITEPDHEPAIGGLYDTPIEHF